MSKRPRQRTHVVRADQLEDRSKLDTETKQPTRRHPQVVAAAVTAAGAIVVAFIGLGNGLLDGRNFGPGAAVPAVPTSTDAIESADPPATAPLGASTGNIVVPSDGTSVATPLDVSGTAHLLSGHLLWLLIRPPDMRFYTVKNEPAPIEVDPGGHWKVERIGIGKQKASDLDHKYRLVLVAAPAVDSEIAKGVARRPPDRISAQFEQLPDDVVVLDSADVTLTAIGQ